MSTQSPSEYPSGRDAESSRVSAWFYRGSWTFLLFATLAFTLHLFQQQASTAKEAVHTSSEVVSAKEAVVNTLPQPDGEQVYTSRCASCHQTNGQGIPGVFPPLAGSEWVTDDKGWLVRIILGGLNGEIEVKGTTYSGAMPPWGQHLSDDEVAALATHVRTSWGNDTTEVTPEEVQKVREATADRSSPWTAEELMSEEHSGIPGEDDSE